MKELDRGKIGLVVQHHEPFGFDWQHGVRAPVKTCKLYFKSAAIVGHHHGAYLTAPQEKRLVCVEMLRWRVLQKGHGVVHMDFAIHTSNYKASRESWKVLSMPDNPLE